jgi:hypothetical protein
MHKETKYCNELPQEMVPHEADVSAVVTSEAIAISDKHLYLWILATLWECCTFTNTDHLSVSP